MARSFAIKLSTVQVVGQALYSQYFGEKLFSGDGLTLGRYEKFQHVPLAGAKLDYPTFQSSILCAKIELELPALDLVGDRPGP